MRKSPPASFGDQTAASAIGLKRSEKDQIGELTRAVSLPLARGGNSTLAFS